MDSIRSLLDESTLQRIANEAGQGVTEQQVEDVLNAVLPGIEKDTASGRLATRAAEAQQQTVTRGGTRAGGMDLLSMLLGGNASTATQTAASNANVSSGQAGSILKIAAPILIYLLLSKTGSSRSPIWGRYMATMASAHMTKDSTRQRTVFFFLPVSCSSIWARATFRAAAEGFFASAGSAFFAGAFLAGSFFSSALAVLTFFSSSKVRYPLIIMHHIYYG